MLILHYFSTLNTRTPLKEIQSEYQLELKDSLRRRLNNTFSLLPFFLFLSIFVPTSHFRFSCAKCDRPAGIEAV